MINYRILCFIYSSLISYTSVPEANCSGCCKDRRYVAPPKSGQKRKRVRAFAQLRPRRGAIRCAIGHCWSSLRFSFSLTASGYECGKGSLSIRVELIATGKPSSSVVVRSIMVLTAACLSRINSFRIWHSHPNQMPPEPWYGAMDREVGIFMQSALMHRVN